MCQRDSPVVRRCAEGVPRLDQRRRQESVPEALYVNACCPSQLLSANQVTQRWTLTSPQGLPPTSFTYKPPRADRWTDRDRLQWMSWLRGLNLVILSQHNEAGLDRQTWQRARRAWGTKHASARVLSHVISFNPFSFHQVYTFKVLKCFCQGKYIYAVQFMQGKVLTVM